MRSILRNHFRFLFVFLFIVTASQLMAQTPYVNWAKNIPATTGGSTIKDLQTDASGNVYVTGVFAGTVTMNPEVVNSTKLVSAGQNDVYVAKYNTLGSLVWAFRLGSTGNDAAHNIAVDAAGMVYVLAANSGSMDADPSSNTTTVNTNGSTDLVVAKYDGNLTPSDLSFFKWGFSMGGASNEIGAGITVDASGMVYILGYGGPSTAFDADPSTNTKSIGGTGYTKTYVAKYDGNVTPSSTSFCKWAFHASGNDNNVLSSSIVVDGSGNVYTAMRFFGTSMTTTVGGSFSKSSGQYDMVLLKFDGNPATPVYKWGFMMGGPDTDEITDMALDAAGMLYVTGNLFSGSMDANPSSGVNTLSASFGGPDLFVAKYNTTLLPSSTSFYQWGFVLGSQGQEFVSDITVDGSGNLYLAGAVSGTMDVDPSSGVNSITANGGTTAADFFLVKYNATQSPTSTSFYKYGFTLGSTGGSERGEGLSIDNNGTVSVGGIYAGSNVDFDPQSATSLNLTSGNTGANSNGFIARYSVLPSPTIGAFADMSKTTQATPFTLTNPSSNSAGAFTYTSSNPTVATVSGNTVTIIAAGTSTITAIQAADGSFAAGTVTALLTVTTPAPAITSFAPLSVLSGEIITITGTDFTGTTAVTLGGVAAASFTVVNSNTITAAVANGATGNVVVTNPQGSGTSSSIFTFALPAPAGGLDFDGVNDYVEIADNNNLDFGSGNFTIETWVNKKAGSANFSNSGVIGKWNTGSSTGTNEWLLQTTSGTGSNNIPSFWMEAGSTIYQCNATTSMQLNTWYHLAAVREGTTLKIYVNGILEGTQTIPANAIINNTNLNMTLGAYRFSSNPLFSAMSMDELRIWSRALCQEEIQNNKDCELNAATQTGLTALYHFNQGIAGADNRVLTVPDAPTVNSVTAGNAQASVSFTANADGGLAITSYTVTAAPGGLTATGTASPITVPGLTNGVSYTFTVTANNAKGISLASAASAAVVPQTVPDAPTAVTATIVSNSAEVSFTAPANNGGSAITSYMVSSNTGGFTASGTSSPITVPGITAGVSYTFRVVAINAIGNSAASTASNSVIILTIPNPPIIGQVIAGNKQASVWFNTPVSNIDLNVTSFTVTSSPGGITATGASSPVVVTGLTNGTSYTFTVKGTNAVGTSAASAVSEAVVPKSAPDAPTNVVAATTAVANRLSVSFTPPANNGGSVITSYTVTSSPGNFTASGASSPILVNGLTLGVTYRFTVTATNAAGTSAASSQSAAITPSSVPGAPTNVSVVVGNAQATVSFNPPSSDGGLAITSYTVTSSPGGTTASGTSSPIVISGLTNGSTYTFTVKATNSKGTGTSSAASSAVTIGSSGSILLVYNAALGQYINALTGNIFSVGDGAEYDPNTGDLKVNPYSGPGGTVPAHIVTPQSNTYVSFDAINTGRYYTYRFSFVDPSQMLEFDRNGDAFASVNPPLYLITSDLKVVDLYDGVSNGYNGILRDPVTGDPITGQVVSYTALQTPGVWLLPAAPTASVNQKKLLNQSPLATTGFVNDVPSYVTGPYDYSNTAPADHIELSGNITTSYFTTIPVPMAAAYTAPANTISVTTSLIDETGNNNGVLKNFALTGNVSNWTAGIASGNCTVFVPATTPITGNNSVCVGSTTALSNATVGGTWSSSNEAVATVSANGLVNGLSAGTAIISYTNTCGGIATVTVTVNALPAANITADGPLTVCSGGSVTLTASAGTSYLWSNNATTQSITVSVAGDYHVKVTDANSCAATSSVTTVTVNITNSSHC